jgi:hypothetical protein
VLDELLEQEFVARDSLDGHDQQALERLDAGFHAALLEERGQPGVLALLLERGEGQRVVVGVVDVRHLHEVGLTQTR